MTTTESATPAGSDRSASPPPARGAAPRPLPPKWAIDVPEPVTYRLKRRFLGPPLHTEALEHERLGNPTALAVFASDCISSSAYASEEILRILIPAVGIFAFSLVVPLTVAMLVVLIFLTLSYRQTIKEYPSAGGAYVVTLDNFGVIPAQVAGVALLTDYILTVAVSTAAGSAALASAVPAFEPLTMYVAIGCVWLVAYGNLRGLRESGAIFRTPTYFFVSMMLVMFAIAFWKMSQGTLPTLSTDREGLEVLGQKEAGLLLGIGLFKLLNAFSQGGTAVTGVEAISNGITAFKKPEWKNAQKTLTVMVVILGSLFLGLSILAAKMHVTPFESGYPTVISEVAKAVYGDSTAGHIAFYLFQAGTMLILIMAANTSFADFPRLASFQAADNFMPRQLVKRGHRLQFSNGIVMLAMAATGLLVATNAKVEHLIPMYAIGVFLSFTLSQSGMARHHLRMREPKWRYGLFVNGMGAGLSLVVLAVFTVTKFAKGAWFIVVLIPVLVAVLVRLNRQYETEKIELEEEASAMASAPVMRRHVTLVFVNKLDAAAARALQYGRALVPDEIRAVHIAIDLTSAEHLADEWKKLPLHRVPLELVDCPDRRVARAAAEVVAAELDGQTEVSVLLPRRLYRRWYHRLLHDSTAEQIGLAVGKLPHANVTTVPFRFEREPTKVERPRVDHGH